ncbi:MAG: hypothetical protein R3301_00765, partial [Saprospiraceae bacterium]|nr:hypothetical protein [Saprospiraceae bacterium]
DIIYVNSTRFWKSEDGGRTWRSRPVPHGDNHDIWINPNNSQVMIQANDGGANVSINGGQTWSSQFNQPTAELYQVEVDDQHPYWLYAGQQDNYTTIAVPSAPPYGMQAGHLGWIMNTGGCETGPAVPKPGDPDIVYANCKGRFSVYNKRTGQEKRYDVGAANMYGHNPRDLKFRFQRVSPIHVSPHDPDVVYHCSQFVHKTTDDGVTWEIISPDLTAFEPDKQVISGSPITRDITGEEFYSTIYAMRESPVEAGVLWVGANDGPVHVSRDGGANWARVTPRGLPPNGRVDCVEPSPHRAGKAYVAVLRYQLGDSKPYIYRTDNFGQSWTLLTPGTNGLPADCPTRVVREDPEREGLLYAGTERGMFVSLDDGKNWHPFQQNLPVTPVTDIKVVNRDVVLSTMGRGFWIMDNVSLLHQGLPAGDEVVLYQPRETTRAHYRGGRSTGDGPRYLRPAVEIDYYLPRPMKDGIRLDIVDGQGRIVRTLVSTDDMAEEAEDAGERDMATGIPAPTVASALADGQGLHRYRWDMRHTGAWHASSGRRYSNGPLVTPGTYIVRLTAGDETHEQSVLIRMDPDVRAEGVTAGDLADLEALSLQVTDLLSDARRLESDLKKQLKQADDEAAASIQASLDKLVTPRGRYQQPMLIDQISYLYGILTRADQAPGRDAIDRYQELRQALDVIANTIDR